MAREQYLLAIAERAVMELNECIAPRRNNDEPSRALYDASLKLWDAIHDYQKFTE